MIWRNIDDPLLESMIWEKIEYPLLESMVWEKIEDLPLKSMISRLIDASLSSSESNYEDRSVHMKLLIRDLKGAIFFESSDLEILKAQIISKYLNKSVVLELQPSVRHSMMMNCLQRFPLKDLAKILRVAKSSHQEIIQNLEEVILSKLATEY